LEGLLAAGKLNANERNSKGFPMLRPYTFYMDETGSRHPDKQSDKSRLGRDWFGFGGVMVRGEDNDGVRDRVRHFSDRWKLSGPAHITDMRSENKAFSWLGKIDQVTREQFWSDWHRVLCESPVIGIGCVIDRPGYRARGYLEKHQSKWLLCRSAFDITIERAVKIAMMEGRKLHVVFEQDAGINSTISGYFQNLKNNGLEFDKENSKRYSPLASCCFSTTLGRIQHKPKSHELLQVADSYIYALARKGYDSKFPLYRHLRDAKRVAEFYLPQECLPHMSVKYYCFDKTKKPS
jgi:hypothetical protein